MQGNRRIAAAVGGALLGLSAMYLLDPVTGRRRRARVRDQMRHFRAVGSRRGGKLARDLGHRAQGLYARASQSWRSEMADDDVIEARVRAAMGRVVSHPSSVLVQSIDGNLLLSGHVLAHEVSGLMTVAARSRGVLSVENDLDVHESAENLPCLQGGVPRYRRTEPRRGARSAVAIAAATAAGLLLSGRRPVYAS